MQALFQPTRTSPPLRLTKAAKVPTAPPSIDLSVISSSTVVVPELRNLTSDDVDFIGAVVRRAGPLATTFPIVFKAYNDVLKERGIDSGEVRYYGKLLKLGTMKGKNWGEKWEAVKRQHNELPDDLNDGQETVSSRVKPRSKLDSQPRKPAMPRLQDIDADTITSDLDDDPPNDVPQYHQTSKLLPKQQYTTSRPSPITQNTQKKASMISSLRGLPASMHGKPPPPPPPTSDTSLSEAETVAPSTALPSYGSAVKAPRYTHQARSKPLATTKTTEISQPVRVNNRFAGARWGIVQSRTQGPADEDDTWNRIRIQQLEAEADRFREERLLERCWAVWRQGYQWIAVSQQQIEEARSAFVLRLALHHWRNSLAARQAMYGDVAKLDDERRLSTHFTLWRKKLRENQQARWRSEMRNKMKIVRDRRGLRIIRDAWAFWRQKYQVSFADRVYQQKVLLLAFLKWKEIFHRVHTIEGKGEQLIVSRGQRLLLHCWQTWRAGAGLAGAEKEMADRVHAGIMWNAWSTWRKHTYDYRRAAFFRDRNIQKRSIVKWENTLQKVHALETRADKHAARQDKVLVCAILRVWLAHVRGREVDRLRDKKLLYHAWSNWKNQVVQNKKRDGLAVTFYHDTRTRVLSMTLSRWQIAFQSRQSTHAMAVRFYDERLCARFGKSWLSRFREGLEERKRQKLVKKLQNRQAARVLYRWLLLTRQKRLCSQNEALIRERVHQRMGQSALSHWTERVIFMRERELHVIEIYNAKLERDTWSRFKAALKRHKENLVLVEDHLALKQEDSLRRFFQRWVANTRVTQHRRYVLQGKEDEVKLMVVQKIWDNWKSNYLERRLRPVEIEMLMRSQQNLMYQAFSVWHAKARTRPAILAVKFNAEHTKKKFYLKWREALPVARMVKKVREKHDNMILSRVFNQWSETYRAKLVLKAVARARHLRLPASGGIRGKGPALSAPITSPPLLPASPPTNESAPISSSRSYPVRPGASHFSRRSPAHGVPIEEHATGNTEAAPSPTGEPPRSSRISRSPFGLGQGTGIVSLLRTNVQHQRDRSDLSPPRPKYRFSNQGNRRGSSVNGSGSRDVGQSPLFATINAESTPPVRGPRSTASDDVGGQRISWNRLRGGRRIRDPSPSASSRLTESPPSSP